MTVDNFVDSQIMWLSMLYQLEIQHITCVIFGAIIKGAVFKYVVPLNKAQRIVIVH